MAPDNLWTVFSPSTAPELIHRFKATAGQLVPSPGESQVSDAEHELEPYTIRDVSY